MMKSRIALLSSTIMGAALLCSAGLAKAQDYGSYGSPAYNDYSYRSSESPAYRDYGTYAPPETVIVRPYYRGVEKRQLVGRVNGEVDPTEFSLSRSVGFGDLDLSRTADRMALRDRVHDTARELCGELDARVPELRGYPSEDRECVRNATREAMRDVYYRRG